MMRRIVFLVTSMATLLGCGPSQYVYGPVNTTAAELGSAPTASYAIPGGAAQVIMLGIRRIESGGSILQAVHIAITVENRSNEMWTLDGAEQRIEAAGESRALFATTSASQRPTMIEIPAHSTGSADLFFRLDGRAKDASTLSAFDLIWTVRIGPLAVTRRTSFERFLDIPVFAPVLPPGGPGFLH